MENPFKILHTDAGTNSVPDQRLQSPRRVFTHSLTPARNCTFSVLRVGFSITTDREDIRRWYEPLGDSIPQRLDAVRQLRDAGIETYITIAPILPCDPERLIGLAIEASGRDVVGEPFHVRAVKTRGAVTRDAANRVSEKRGFLHWYDPGFINTVIETMQVTVAAAGHRFGSGPAAFGWLAKVGDDGSATAIVASRREATLNRRSRGT